jgi:spermidine/putrescine transport system permease protein
MGHKIYRWIADRWTLVLGLIVLVYMFVPIYYVVRLSLDRPKGRLDYDINDKFTTEFWSNPCGAAGMCESVVKSLGVGLLATIVATILGTLMAFALARHRFRGRAPTNLLIFLPMATPEIVMGSSLLALFVSQGIPLGFWTVLIAHVMFCVSFVVVTVKARLAGLDPRLEEAAMDLYANERQTFLRVTLPLVLPGIVAAALLSFSLSFDDFIITNFNTSNTFQTFPLFIWGSSLRGIPREVNVVGTVMFLVAFIIVVAGEVLNRRRQAALKA